MKHNTKNIEYHLKKILERLDRLEEAVELSEQKPTELSKPVKRNKEEL